MLTINNCRVIIPQTEDIELTVYVNETTSDYLAVTSRGELSFTYTMALTTQLEVPWDRIPSAQMVEIYKNGIRVINRSIDFGETHLDPPQLTYEINDKMITFNQPVAAEIKVICDQRMEPRVPDKNIITFDNIFGGETVAPEMDETYAATWCEPVICTQPYNGFARLTDDRKSIIYVPNPGYVGADSFSYTLITSRGQTAETKCVYITIENPPPPPPDPEPVV